MKAHAPTTYWRLIRARHGVAMSIDRRRVSANRPDESPGDTYRIDLDLNAGFFASMSAYLAILHYCEVRRLVPDVRLVNPVYGQRTAQHDWFPQYFERLSPQSDGASGHRRLVVRDLKVLRLSTRLNEVPLAVAAAIFDRHASVAPATLAQMDLMFAQDPLNAGHILGVHYRGTDKVMEASRAPYDDVIVAVKRELSGSGPYSCVLVATDEPDFALELGTAISDIPVVPMDATQIGDRDTPPHMMANADRYVLGIEALETCLALARCSALVRTSSYLSGWSKVFNPSLKTITLNSPNRSDGFPEALILEEECLRGHPA